MNRRHRLVLLSVPLALAAWAALAAPDGPAATADLDADQIVARNAEARGGIEAWRRVQTLRWSGHMESADATLPLMRFELTQQRPNKTRFEVDAVTQKTLRVFDGTHGWKSHPDAQGRPEVHPYSALENRFAQDEEAIDGPLMDYAAHGSTVVLVGREDFEGRPAWRLRVHLSSGFDETVWVDTQTFLEVRYDRTSFNANGAAVSVPVVFRDYREFSGLRMPSIIQLGLDGSRPANRMMIDQVVVNPPIGDHVFMRPGPPRRSSAAAVIDTVRPLPGAAAAPQPWPQRTAASPK